MTRVYRYKLGSLSLKQFIQMFEQKPLQLTSKSEWQLMKDFLQALKHQSHYEYIDAKDPENRTLDLICLLKMSLIHEPGQDGKSLANDITLTI